MDILKKCSNGPSFEYIGSVKKWCCIWHAQEYCYTVEKNRDGKFSKSLISSGEKDEDRML